MRHRERRHRARRAESEHYAERARRNIQDAILHDRGRFEGVSGCNDLHFAPMAQPPPQPRFTPKQGQYLAFIYAYSRLHRRAAAEADMQRHFEVSPPAVHQMVLGLERAMIPASASRFEKPGLGN